MKKAWAVPGVMLASFSIAAAVAEFDGFFSAGKYESPLLWIFVGVMILRTAIGGAHEPKPKRKLIKYLFRYSDGSTEEVTVEQDAPMTISSNSSKQLIQLQVYNFEKED